LTRRRRASASLGVMLPLVAPLPHRAGDTAGGGVAQRAEGHLVRRSEADTVGDPEQRVDVPGVALAVDDPPRQLDDPAGALATRRALAAGLVVVELGQP